MPSTHLRESPRSRMTSWQGLGVMALVLSPLSAAAMPCTNMTLVLAIDGSGSISDSEFALQLDATARALTDPQVVQAMADLGGVAVTALIWADTAFGAKTLDWVRIADAASAMTLAQDLRSVPRNVHTPRSETSEGETSKVFETFEV